MDGFLEGLSQQILAALGVGDQAVDGQYQVVSHQRIRRGEIPQVAEMFLTIIQNV